MPPTPGDFAQDEKQERPAASCDNLLKIFDLQAKNADFYRQYVTEDFTTYLNRKRIDHCHGNHLEIQALTEIYNRAIEVYQYSTGKF